MPVERWRPSPAAIVVADPAREGLGPRAVESLGRAEPGLFVLVSCAVVAALILWILVSQLHLLFRRRVYPTAAFVSS